MMNESGSTRPTKTQVALPAEKISRKGLKFEAYFSTEGQDAFDEVGWEKRTAAIKGEGGETFFEQKDVEVPKNWSQMATNVVVQKYFRGVLGSPSRENSVRQLIGRVADTITQWGKEGGYFTDEASAKTFHNELKHLLIHQKMAFNSPVWFNVGVEAKPQCSACFINSVADSMDSILTLAKTEGMLFKYGSGTGTNMSSLRSSKELLNGGGTSSGPVSFMKGFDAFAGVIKSGGKTRRAAKMVILNASHPDIVEFINCKVKEEKKAWALIDAGYDGSFTGEAYGSVFFQNSNNSVRVTDEFMKAVENDGDWTTISVVGNVPMETMKARDLWKQIAEAAWHCGDPGLQFDTTINQWHTSSAAGRINASNPCSEFMYLDDTACNLASLNLRKFQYTDGSFNVEAFEHAVDITILAQEILVDNASYPTLKIADNSRKYRPLGLGYANLGALLMSLGLPYDSAPGRAYAAAVTALMHGRANLMSAKIAEFVTGPFEGYEANETAFLGVMANHRKAVQAIDTAYVPFELMRAVADTWEEAFDIGFEHGFRNGQVTVLAPTGTIGFMMDCDTTGIEPDIALIKYKRLVGGGTMKIVNQTVPEALARIGYSSSEILEITKYIDNNETIEGAPALKPEHLSVFDCAFKPARGARSIHYMGHIRMMAATQPFLSGAISKTVNLPNDCTVKDIQEAYAQSWKLGLKAVAVYRDGCKRSQPLSTSKKTNLDGTLTPSTKAELQVPPAFVATRRRLPDTRESVTHKFSVGGHDGYFIVGIYEDGTPGEIFIRMAKEGSTICGMMDSFAIAISIALQYGVPLKLLADKFQNTKFEPSGWTGNQEIPRASSLMDYIFKWMKIHFSKDESIMTVEGSITTINTDVIAGQTAKLVSDVRSIMSRGTNGHATKSNSGTTWKPEADAPFCVCGSQMVRNGACYKCINCGETSGCS